MNGGTITYQSINTAPVFVTSALNGAAGVAGAVIHEWLAAAGKGNRGCHWTATYAGGWHLAERTRESRP